MNWQVSFLDRFESRLRELLITEVDDSKFKEALLYQFFPSGKRIRPLLMAALTLDLGGNSNECLDYACAIEILHTASLVHDDLPALDNDKERRGRPTLHVAVGEGMALLVGDYLIARGFSIAASNSSAENSGKTAALIGVLGKAFCDVCFGQELDIRNSTQILERSLQLYDLKTGALFSACLEMARLIRNDDVHLSSLLKNFSTSLGRTFQVLNDLKDKPLDLSFGLVERTRNSDAQNNRVTALGLVEDCNSLDFVNSLVNQTWEQLTAIEAYLANNQDYQIKSFTHLRDVLLMVIVVPSQ